MIIYSAEPRRGFVANVGDRVIYGEDENNLQGVGCVTTNEKGRLVVNDQPMETLLRKYGFLRKMA